MHTNLSTLIFIITALQSVIAAVVFLFQKNISRQFHPRLISTLFFLIAATYTDAILDRTGIYLEHPQFAFIANTLGLGIPAIIYLYSRAITVEHFRFRWYDIFHATPVVVTGFITLFAYHLKSREEQLQFWNEGHTDSILTSPMLSTFILLTISIQIIMLFRRMYRHSKAMRQVRSDTLDEMHIVLKGFGLAYLGIIILNAIRTYLQSTNNEELAYIVEILIGLWSYLMISALLLGMSLRPERRMALTDEEVKITGFETINETDNEQSISEEGEYWPQLDQGLKQYMEQNKPYLDANLTLIQLARKLGVPSRQLSSFINSRIGCNFSDYIADWRIDEFKQLCLESTPSINITDAMFASGFNTKSTFNTHFKKRTGITPTQWRDSGNSFSETNEKAA